MAEEKNNLPKGNPIDIADLDKLLLQYRGGLSIRQLSIIWNLPYATLYRALKGREEEVREQEKKNG